MPRSIRLDQARCLIGIKVKNFSKNNNYNKIIAIANDHPASGSVVRLIYTIQRHLSCIKLTSKTNTFS